MSMEIVRLGAADYEDAMDFLNLVFSQAHRPHDFAVLLPKICRPEEEYMRMYLAVRREGRIRAIVTTVPMTLHIAGRTLSVVGIGNVSTHQNERGSGLMRLLMTRAMEEIDAAGVDFSCLGGLRQRYANYGYEVCGSRYAFRLTARNAASALGDAPPLSWTPLNPDDGAALAQVRTLYERQPLYVERGDSGDFYRFLTSWKAKPYAASGQDGALRAYLCMAGGVNELFTAETDGAAYVRALSSWVLQNGLEQAEVGILPWERELQRALGRVCEGWSVQTAGHYRIMNWDKVLDACFALKASYAAIPDGEAVIGVEGWGNLALQVEHGVPSVVKTDRTADVTLSRLDAARFVFGPLPPSAVTAIKASAAAVLDAWLPLPLSFHRQDSV